MNPALFLHIAPQKPNFSFSRHAAASSSEDALTSVYIMIY